MKSVLFLSDFHLGVPDENSSKDREKKICALLDKLKQNVSEVFFVGDVFDFWFEYGTVVPKGYYRFLGKLAELSDMGVQLHFFRGNHDMWMRNLFTVEFGAKVYSYSIFIERLNKKILVGHGDGLGPKDYRYKFLKLFFSSSFCQFLFRWIHPDIGIRMASFFSYRSRFGQEKIVEQYFGNSNEWLYIYSQEILKRDKIDYFIFGHRHLPIYTEIEDSSSIYVNLGDWLDYNTYALLDQNGLSLYQNDTEKKNSDFDPNR